MNRKGKMMGGATKKTGMKKDKKMKNRTASGHVIA